MTCTGIGDVTSQDIGAALSQAGTILNPGTYTTLANGQVVYTPAAGANVPGGLPATGTSGNFTTLLIVGFFIFLMSRK